VPRPSAPHTVAVVKAIVVVPFPACVDLYALLQCGEDFKYLCKTYDGYIDVFRVLLVEDDASSPPASGTFQYTSA
jgi:hypothetical protein